MCSSITSEWVLHYFSQLLSVHDGRESMSKDRSPSLPENCWKGELKRCSVKSVTNIYMLSVLCASCSWMHKVSFPLKSQWAQSTNCRVVWSSWLIDVQSHSLCHCINFCCHWILRNVNIGREIFSVLGVFLVVLKIHVLEPY